MKRLPVNLATHPIEQRQWLRKVTLRTAVAAVALTLAHMLLAWSLVDELQTTTPNTAAVTLLQEWSDEVATLMLSADPRTTAYLVECLDRSAASTERADDLGLVGVGSLRHALLRCRAGSPLRDLYLP